MPLPGQTVPDVASQLTWRVMGPYKNRARSVLCWARVIPGAPTQPKGVAELFGITDRAVGQRINRVAAAGRDLPLHAALELEIIRPSRP